MPAARGSGRTNSRGYTAAWKRLRQQALEFYGPVCHLCHKGIDVDLPAKDRMSYTLDHLDPVELNGPSLPSLDRVRPAHRGCNSSRGIGAQASPTSRDW